MKFGKQLEMYHLPEWRGHYLPYNDLKKRLEKLKERPIATPLWSGANTSENVDPEEAWRQEVESEGLRIGEFVNRGMQGLEAQISDLSNMAIARNRRKTSHLSESDGGIDDETRTMELRFLDSIGRLVDGALRLKGFAEVNHAALYKILKKHDKVLKSTTGLKELFPTLVDRTQLGDETRFEVLDEKLRNLSKKTTQTQGLEASPAVVRLAAGLGRGRGGTNEGPSNRKDRVLFFFMGVTMALLFSIGVLISLPAGDPDTFSLPYFLSNFAPFRVVFEFVLMYWVIGLVMFTCDSFHINYAFLLNLDPRCAVMSTYFFTRAGLVTSVWIFVFSLYIIDYKWEEFSFTLRHNEGRVERCSVRYFIYPATSLAVGLVAMAWPSRVMIGRYIWGIINSFGRTVFAPLFVVTFAENLLGDILTSLSKPLQDIPRSTCYIFSSHPVSILHVSEFQSTGDMCPRWVESSVLPVIAGLPYWFRAWQCLRRYYDKREPKHLVNFGKYVTSLLVVVVTSLFGHSPPAVIAVCFVATAYAASWDILMDWGLTREQIWSSKKNVEVVDANLEPLAPNPEKAPERFFANSVYWLCTVIDIFARMTWCLSLMPTHIFAKSCIQRALLPAFVAGTEIFRRGMWAVIRIEWEQVSNASGYRALMWVPSKLNTDKTETGPH